MEARSRPRLLIEEDVKSLSEMPSLEHADDLAFQNPPAAMQESFVGASYEQAYSLAARFLNHLLQHLPEPTDSLLDFGCGWGRMLRMLRRHPDLKGVQMFGCDLSLEALEMNRRTLPQVWLSRTGSWPPSVYRDGMFDAVYAYSVFSHLSEANHRAWAAEFGRILRPGGRALVTTQPKSFFDLCRKFRVGQNKISHIWHERLAASFVDEDSEERYDRGEFMYQPGLGSPETYGEAVVPRQFFESAWREYGFSLIDWNTGDQQNWALLEKSDL